MNFKQAKLNIYSCSTSKELSEAIAKEYGTKLGTQKLQVFRDGEFQPSYEESIRGNIVFIIQSTMPPSDNLMELLLMIDAAKRASAYKIAVVIPYFGFARQDRKDKPRVPIGAKLIADILTVAGANRVITMDLHADSIQGFFDIPVDHLYAYPLIKDYIKKLNLDNLVIASPDMGAAKKSSLYSKSFNCGFAICYKERKKANQVDKMTVIGDVKGKNIIMIDDMVDTAGTICMAADMMKAKGAKSVRAIVSHPVLSGNAYENIENSSLIELVVSNTIPIKKKIDKIKIIDVAPIFSKAIKNIYNNTSISTEFKI